MGSDSDVIHFNNGEMRCNGIDPKLFNIKLQHCMTSQSGLHVDQRHWSVTSFPALK